MIFLGPWQVPVLLREPSRQILVWPLRSKGLRVFQMPMVRAGRWQSGWWRGDLPGPAPGWCSHLPPGCTALCLDIQLQWERTGAVICSFSPLLQKTGGCIQYLNRYILRILESFNLLLCIMYHLGVLGKSNIPVSPAHTCNQTSQGSHDPLEFSFTFLSPTEEDAPGACG